MRLTRHTAHEKVLDKGTLRPEIAWMLCWLSEPREGELMLDPFCGSGAIPLMRATQFPRGLVLASDLDAALVEKLKAKVKEGDLKRRVVVRQGDARQLSRYADGSIHKIVTDPPWGLFQELAGGPEAFYREVLAELARVLIAGGLLVILLARADFLPPLLETLPRGAGGELADPGVGEEGGGVQAQEKGRTRTDKDSQGLTRTKGTMCSSLFVRARPCSPSTPGSGTCSRACRSGSWCPISMKGGTMTTSPVSIFAGL